MTLTFAIWPWFKVLNIIQVQHDSLNLWLWAEQGVSLCVLWLWPGYISYGQGPDTPFVYRQQLCGILSISNMSERGVMSQTWIVYEQLTWHKKYDLRSRSWQTRGQGTTVEWIIIKNQLCIKEQSSKHRICVCICCLTSESTIFSVTAHKCAGGLKKKFDIRSDYNAIDFVVFLNVACPSKHRKELLFFR